ncbi:MAG TPA: alginate export family protein [Usitatibacter sp.]|nr:alginate export family protein [Usitatibacter sp.]
MRAPFRALALTVGALATQLLCAQPACPEPPAYRFLRFDESYAYLRRPECAVDPFDVVKYRDIGFDGWRASFGADVRIRLETGQDIRYTTAPPNPRNDVVQRYHVHAELRLDDRLRFFGELKANETAGRPVPIPTDENKLDVHQAFVDFHDAATRLRAGRQEFTFGGMRRLFPRNGPNVRGSYDAVRITHRDGEWSVDALAFRPVGIDAGRFDDSSIGAQRGWGVYGSGPAIAGLRFDAYYLGLAREGSRFVQGIADELRHSIGARAFGRAGAWDHDHEVTVQSGHFGTGNIRAWAVEGEVGYTFAGMGPAPPRFSLRYDAGSGDRDPADARLETFNALFPRGGVTGEIFNFSPANLLHVRLGVDQRVTSNVGVVVSVDGFWRTSLRDGVYGTGGNIMAAAPASRARYVGWDADATVNWRLSRQVVLGFSAGYFRNGTFSRDAGLPRRQWLFFPVLSIQV